MKNKINLHKVYRERIKPELTEAEQNAMEAALAAPLLCNEEIKRRMMVSGVKARAFAAFVKILCAAMLFFVSAGTAEAICKGSPLNPITDICWQCMFPWRIGGLQVGGGGAGSAPGNIKSVLCECFSAGQKGKHAFGISTAFWEHARLIETVKDPWCMPALGAGMNSGGGLSALLAGSNKTGHGSGTDSDYSSQQVHYYIFPVWDLLNLFIDFPCVETEPFDLAYMTEVDPLWQDDALSFILNPEALLFGNPNTQLACMADTVGAAAGKPLDPLFWCMGSWGSAYPLSGSNTVTNPTALNAGMASKMIYKLAREGLQRDTAVDECSRNGRITPTWNKSNYRLQVAKPRRGNECIPIGQPDLLWGAAKNPVFGAGGNAPDNFLWVLTRARTCCVNYLGLSKEESQ